MCAAIARRVYRLPPPPPTRPWEGGHRRAREDARRPAIGGLSRELGAVGTRKKCAFAMEISEEKVKTGAGSGCGTMREPLAKWPPLPHEAAHGSWMVQIDGEQSSTTRRAAKLMALHDVEYSRSCLSQSFTALFQASGPSR